MVKGKRFKDQLKSGVIRLLAVSIYLFAGLLTGCTGLVPPTAIPEEIVATSTKRPSITPTATAIPPEDGIDMEDLKGIQVLFWHPWNGETQNVILQMVDQFNQSNAWGIHVVMQEQGSAGANEANLWSAIEALEAPQVVAVSPQMLLAIDERAGLVLDLEDYINSPKVGMTAEQTADFNQEFWQEDVHDGKRYGIPVQRSMTVLFYNLTWAKELGFSSIPESPEDLQAQVCSANRAMRLDGDLTNDGIGGMLISKDADSMLGWLSAFGSVFHTAGGYQFDTGSTEKTYQYLLSLSRDACMWERKNPQPYDYFAKRQALVYSGQLQDIAAQTSANKRNDSTDVWGIIPFPGETGSMTVTGGFSLGILESSPEKDLAAWLFIRWLSEPAQQARLLTTQGTLPIGEEVFSLTPEIGTRYPQWNTAVRYLNTHITAPMDADWSVVRQVVEDSAWQLFLPGTTSAQVKPILQQMDELAAELGSQVSMSTNQIIVYTDGGCDPNPGPGGWGVLIFRGTTREEYSGAELETTNNRMELTAAIEALKRIKEPSSVLLFADSQYVVKGITEWMPRWLQKNWKGSSGMVANRDLWEALLVAAKPHRVSWRWMKGHTGNPYNERVDQLCREAREVLARKISR